MVDLSMAMLNYQRVHHGNIMEYSQTKTLSSDTEKHHSFHNKCAIGAKQYQGFLNKGPERYKNDQRVVTFHILGINRFGETPKP